MMSRMMLAAVVLSVVTAQAASIADPGTSAALLQNLAGQSIGAGSAFVLPLPPPGGQVDLTVEDFHLQDGYLSMTGVARGSAGSEFILKGSASDLYGWVVLRDVKRAYEYTTDAAGRIKVEEVPITRIFPDCDLPDPGNDHGSAAPPPEPEAAPFLASGPEPHIGPYPNVDILKLQSLPGAEKVLWIKMNRIMTGTTPKGWTKAQVWEFWQGFASGFSMFKVNVTTDSSVAAAAGVKNTGIAIMYDSAGTSSCGLNIFGTTRGCTIYRKSSAKYQGGTLIHETGHMLGLSHDGSPGQTYFPGFSTYQWCPVMGNHPAGLRWTNILWQWSRGEYRNANQTQDDFTVMGRHLSFRDDDLEGTRPLQLTPMPLAGDSVSALLNRGQIARNTDADSFTFEMPSGGRAKLRVDRTEYGGGSMLDLEAFIFDADGKQMARSNVVAARHATFDLNLPGGEFTLVVRGGAEGSPDSGFSRYSSLGFYGISGSLARGVVVGLAGDDGFNRAIQVSRPGSSARLDLRFPTGAKVRAITLTSVRGDRVFQTREKVASIDLSPFPAGYYGLRIDMDGATVVRKIAKM